VHRDIVATLVADDDDATAAHLDGDPVLHLTWACLLEAVETSALMLSRRQCSTSGIPPHAVGVGTRARLRMDYFIMAIHSPGQPVVPPVVELRNDLALCRRSGLALHLSW
jgi:hypothetical protein